MKYEYLWLWIKIPAFWLVLLHAHILIFGDGNPKCFFKSLYVFVKPIPRYPQVLCSVPPWCFAIFPTCPSSCIGSAAAKRSAASSVGPNSRS